MNIPKLVTVPRQEWVLNELDFHSLVQTCPDAILLLDRNSRIVGLNPAATSLFGYYDHELLGNHASLILPKFSEDEQLPGDIEAVTANGLYLKLAATWGRLRDKTSVFLRDVTESRRIEADLKASEENLRLLMETIPALVYIGDARGALQQVNHRVAEFNGVSPAQLVKENGLTAVHPEDRPVIAELLRRQFQMSEPFHYEFRQRRFDGTYRWFHASVQPLKGADGRVTRWYTLLTDIDDCRNSSASSKP
jgi:PAS domain S-box-containing protein